MSAAARAEIWAQERREQWRRPLLMRDARPGGWVVARVNDDGREEVLRTGLRAEDAERIAGQLRDACPEDDVAAGWNYLPRKMRASADGRKPGRAGMG